MKSTDALDLAESITSELSAHSKTLLGIERRKTLAQSAKDAEREAQLVAFQIEVESNQMTDAELAAVGVRLQELLRTAEKCRARAALYDHFKLGIPQVQFKRVLN